MSAPPRPDLSGRPHRCTVEHAMKASPAAVYRAWTERFDTWFATPGVIRMRAEVNEPFYFAVEHQGARHAHYGRFLTLDPDRFLELTWVTGKDGTDGAETVVSVELTDADADADADGGGGGGGTRLRLTHAGFYDQAAAEQHEHAWPQVLAHLDQTLTGQSV